MNNWLDYSLTLTGCRCLVQSSAFFYKPELGVVIDGGVGVGVGVGVVILLPLFVALTTVADETQIINHRRRENSGKYAHAVQPEQLQTARTYV